MRGAWLAGAALVPFLVGGCGGPSTPTQAEVRAQTQWFVDHAAALAGASQPAHLFTLKTQRGSTFIFECDQFSTASVRGFAAPPMPVAALEELWRSYLLDLRAVARSCSQGDNDMTLTEGRKARGVLAQLMKVAQQLPAEAHSLPPR